MEPILVLLINYKERTRSYDMASYRYGWARSGKVSNVRTTRDSNINIGVGLFYWESPVSEKAHQNVNNEGERKWMGAMKVERPASGVVGGVTPSSPAHRSVPCGCQAEIGVVERVEQNVCVERRVLEERGVLDCTYPFVFGSQQIFDAGT